MLSLSSNLKYYLYSTPVDMRKSFDGLGGIILDQMHKNPLDSSCVYMFINKNRDKMKLLHWESGGFVLYYKRLERGGFSYVKEAKVESGQVHLNWAELVVLLQGFSLSKISKTQVRYPLK